MRPPSHLLSELGRLAQRSGEMAKEIRVGIQRELKLDGTIVTAADRKVEEYLRIELPKLVEGTTVWGEEYGYEASGPNGLWAVDPVDGTSNFSFGSPLWGVSIGLVSDNEALLGAIFLPDLNEMYLAEKGQGAYCNGIHLPPIPPGPIRDEELISYGDYLLRDFPDYRFPGRMRCSGAFVIDGTFVARQRYRGLLGIRERLYDVAATIAINRELGAEIRYADGDPLLLPDLMNRRIEKPWIIFPSECGFRM